jgi:hypothetical protein
VVDEDDEQLELGDLDDEVVDEDTNTIHHSQ